MGQLGCPCVSEPDGAEAETSEYLSEITGLKITAIRKPCQGNDAGIAGIHKNGPARDFARDRRSGIGTTDRKVYRSQSSLMRDGVSVGDAAKLPPLAAT